jgi:hypothetical protein
MSGSNSNKKNEPTAIPKESPFSAKSQQTVLTSPNSHSAPHSTDSDQRNLRRTEVGPVGLEAMGYAIIRSIRTPSSFFLPFDSAVSSRVGPFVTAGLGTAQRATITMT